MSPDSLWLWKTLQHLSRKSWYLLNSAQAGFMFITTHRVPANPVRKAASFWMEGKSILVSDRSEFKYQINNLISCVSLGKFLHPSEPQIYLWLKEKRYNSTQFNVRLDCHNAWKFQMMALFPFLTYMFLKQTRTKN